jgi:hypothetical protein
MTLALLKSAAALHFLNMSSTSAWDKCAAKGWGASAIAYTVVPVTATVWSRSLLTPESNVSVIHRQSRYLINRAENSHQPTRTRERQMKRFRSPEQAQRFLSIFESINASFRLSRHLLSTPGFELPPDYNIANINLPTCDRNRSR